MSELITKTKSEEKKKSVLRVDLWGEHKDLMEQIKDENHFSSYAATIRHCILETSQKREFHLNETYWNKIANYLEYDIVKHEHHIYSIQDFVNKALEYFFRELQRRNNSIMSFDVRSELNDDELKIALAILACQNASFEDQVTIDDVANQMGKRNKKGISKIMDSFVSRGILSRRVLRGEVFYHAKPLSV